MLLSFSISVWICMENSISTAPKTAEDSLWVESGYGIEGQCPFHSRSFITIYSIFTCGFHEKERERENCVLIRKAIQNTLQSRNLSCRKVCTEMFLFLWKLRKVYIHVYICINRIYINTQKYLHNEDNFWEHSVIKISCLWEVQAGGTAFPSHTTSPFPQL